LGVEFPIQNIDIKNKIKSTNIDRYGVDNPSKSDRVKNKIRSSIIKKYGTLNLNSIKEISDKIKKTNIEKYNEEHISKNIEYRLKYRITNDMYYIEYKNNGISLFSCDYDLPHEFDIDIDNYTKRKKSNIPLCTVCNPIGDSVSIKEKELFNFIDSIYDGKIIQSYRDGLEIDIYLPELKIGFELNGLYWHSEEFKDKNYHLNKSRHFEEKGIRIIHIWEDDWTFKRNILESQIINWLGLTNERIYARNCVVKEIKDYKTINEFLNDNHIQGGSSNNKVSIGLFYKKELISIMTFDKNEGRKKMEESGWNLSRFCNKLNMSVVGGASKLLNFFIKNYNPTRVISYADRDWSLGNLYLNLKFKLVSMSNPDYKYITENKRVHKSRFKKSKLGIKGSKITESTYMRSIGLYRIWDCGKIKYELFLYT